MGGRMSQPAWKAALRNELDEEFIASGEEIFDLVMPHIEAAFKRGEDAAKLREGSRLVVENERLRRERYARALYVTLDETQRRLSWEALIPPWRTVWYQRADASMAVADEEQRELASLATNAANALRDEKRQYEIACEENARLRSKVTGANEDARQAMEQRREMAAERDNLREEQPGNPPTARREAWESAITPWITPDPVRQELVDAVMAVADEELDSVHKALDEERDVAVRMEAANARLRAELEQIKKGLT